MRVGPGAQIRVAAGWGWRRAPAVLSGRGQTQKHSAPSSAATRLLSGTGWVGSGEKEHPMMYSPRAQRFVPLSTKQVAAAVWNRTVQPYSDDVMPAFAPLHAVATRKACELLQGTGESCPHVLDIGSAAGEPALSVALALPDAEVVATDFSGLAALGGRARAARAGAKNIIFQFSDAEDLQFDDDSFDLVVCCLVLSVCDENAALGGIERILKPGGAVLIIDFAELAESAYLRSVQAAVVACIPEHASLSASFGLRPWRLCEEASGTGICQRLHDLGFEDYSEEHVHVALDTAGESDEQLWARVRGPMLALLETMRDIDQTDVKDSEALPARQAFLAALQRPGEETAGGSGGIRWRDNKFRMWTARKPRARGWGIF